MQEVQGVETQQSYISTLSGVHGWEQPSGPPSVNPAMVLSQKFAIELPDIRFDGTTYRLNTPLCLLLYVEDDCWSCEDEGQHIISFGDASETALHSFCEDFSVLWNEIAKVEDESLSPDARRLKKFLASVVQSVSAE
jgi:hypothetical protein